MQGVLDKVHQIAHLHAVYCYSHLKNKELNERTTSQHCPTTTVGCIYGAGNKLNTNLDYIVLILPYQHHLNNVMLIGPFKNKLFNSFKSGGNALN